MPALPLPPGVEGFVSLFELPDESWEGRWSRIVAPEGLKERLLNFVLFSLRHRGRIDPVGLPVHGLVVLAGPPGTGKTTLAGGLADRAARELGGLLFAEVDAHAFPSQLLGESQRAVARLFGRTLPDLAARALTLEPDIVARSERYRFMEHAMVVGRGLNYATAFEFALKLMETCYVIAERFSAADLLHGPIAMIEPSFPSFLFAPTGVTWPGMREMLAKLEQLKAETLIITDQSNQEARAQNRAICVPAQLEELYTPIPYIIPAQLFSACLAAEKGLNPDQPRTISKVTRTM